MSTSTGSYLGFGHSQYLAFICRAVLQVSNQRYYLVFHSISDCSTVQVPHSAACLTTLDEVSNDDHYPSHGRSDEPDSVADIATFASGCFWGWLFAVVTVESRD